MLGCDVTGPALQKCFSHHEIMSHKVEVNRTLRLVNHILLEKLNDLRALHVYPVF